MLASGASFLSLRASLRCRDKRSWAVLSVFGALFSAAVVVGRRVDEEAVEFLGLTASDLVYWVCFSLFFAALGVTVSQWLRAHPLSALTETQEEPVVSRIMSWASWSGLIALCFLFYYFVFFPGLMTGDSFACYVRAAGIAPISNQQPVVYQLVMADFLALGNLFDDPNAGIAFFVLFQLLCMASIFGYTLYWMRRRGCPRWVLWLLGAVVWREPAARHVCRHGVEGCSLWRACCSC